VCVCVYIYIYIYIYIYMRVNVAAELLPLILCLRKDTGSHLDLESGCPVCECSWFLSVPSDKRRNDTLNYSTTASFRILSCSLLVKHNTIRHCKARATEIR
jgi:hypothetical protein